MYAENLDNEWPLIWTVYLVVFKHRKTLPVNFVYTTVAGFAT